MARGKATVPSWKAKNRAARAWSGHSHLLIMEFCRPWESSWKRDPIDLIKHRHSLHRGLPCVTPVLVASNQHQVQWGLLEGNLMLTSPLVRFIGRKSGAHWINRRLKEQAWKMARTSPDSGPLEQSDQDAGHHCCYGLLTKTNPNIPSALSPGSKDKAPVRSSWFDCQVTNYLCPGHQEMERRIMSSLGLREKKAGPTMWAPQGDPCPLSR